MPCSRHMAICCVLLLCQELAERKCYGRGLRVVFFVVVIHGGGGGGGTWCQGGFRDNSGTGVMVGETAHTNRVEESDL